MTDVHTAAATAADTAPDRALAGVPGGTAPGSGTITDLVRTRIEQVAPGWLDQPVLRGVADGTLDHTVFRHYLEQDYLYLAYYARIYVRLAAAAEAQELVERFVGLAHAIYSTELDHHREAAAPFGCDFDRVVPSPELRQYLAFFEEIKGDAGETMVAMTPCLYGYGLALGALRERTTGDGEYATWLRIYDGAEYAKAVERHLALLDTAAVTPERALQLTDRALELERAFWNQQPRPEPSTAATPHQATTLLQR
jgi:thiaminase